MPRSVIRQLPLPGVPDRNYVTGGTTGGEGERNIRIVFAWDPGRWPDGGPETPDVFWEYYLNEQVAGGYLQEVVKCQESRGISETSFQPEAKPR